MSSESKYVKDASVLPVTWLKGSASQGNDQCVEIGSAGDAVFIRDSKNPAGPALAFTRAEWIAALLGAKDGEFDGI
jgi:hypothetical protein